MHLQNLKKPFAFWMKIYFKKFLIIFGFYKNYGKLACLFYEKLRI